MSTRSRSGRAAGVLLAGAAAATLVAGCGRSGARNGSAAASSTTSASLPGNSGLANGLLPSEAFGPGTTVVGLTLDQLRQAAAGALGSVQGVQVTPPQCAAVLADLQAGAGAVGDLAAQAATGPGQVTVEALVTGGPATEGVATLRSALTSCPQLQVTAPMGTGTITLAPVDVGSMGDQAAAAQLTATVTPENHAPVTLTALLGAVQDHDRLLLLLTATQGAAAPDQAQFTSLLQKASSTQAEALD
jgi:hypothetical protein